MQAEVTHVFLKPKHGEPVIPVKQCTAVTEQGLVGDVSFGRADRQVLLIDLETLQEFDLAPGAVRENLTVSGVALSGAHRLSVGEVILEVTGDCAPCSTMDELQPGLQERIRGRRGVLARVVRGGQIHIGDQISIEAASN
jgi:MOSC domain-containing protein YiiM